MNTSNLKPNINTIGVNSMMYRILTPLTVLSIIYLYMQNTVFLLACIIIVLLYNVEFFKFRIVNMSDERIELTNMFNKHNEIQEYMLSDIASTDIVEDEPIAICKPNMFARLEVKVPTCCLHLKMQDGTTVDEEIPAMMWFDRAALKRTINKTIAKQKVSLV